jgi:hypothetical protein
MSSLLQEKPARKRRDRTGCTTRLTAQPIFAGLFTVCTPMPGFDIATQNGARLMAVPQTKPTAAFPGMQVTLYDGASAS